MVNMYTPGLGKVKSVFQAVLPMTLASFSEASRSVRSVLPSSTRSTPKACGRSRFMPCPSKGCENDRVTVVARLAAVATGASGMIMPKWAKHQRQRADEPAKLHGTLLSC